MNEDQGHIQSDADAPFTRQEGWHWARLAFGALFNFCPEPDELARQRVLTRGLWHAIASWLAPLERFVRRLLLLEALALPAQNAPAPGKAARPSVKTACGRTGFASEKTSDWSVSFRAISPIVCQRATTIRTRRTALQALAPGFMFSQALAERIEALTRVFEQSAAYAQRLARRLARASGDFVRRVIGKPRAARREDPIGAPLDTLSYNACVRAAAGLLDSS